MTKFLKPLALVIVTLAAPSAMAGVTFYESENFGGNRMTMDGAVPDFRARNFNDRARSAVVEGTPVEVCLDPNYAGGCTILNPGRYSTLGNANGLITSARPVRGDMRGDDNRGDMRGDTARGGVTFYEAENFGGNRMTMDGAVPDLRARNFNDRARSAVVEGTPVEVCLDPNYAGGCTILNPGRYATLGNANGLITSARPVRGDMRGDDNRGDMRGDNRGDMRDGRGGGRWGSATLYGGPNFTGRAVALDRQGAEDLMNFNDRASSLKVERGYWIFCSEPQFRGECRTFGPGEYRQLPPELDNRISSGRRISNQYPYASTPNWENRR